MNELLVFDQVEICYHGKPVVQDISFSVNPGEVLGIAGESGSGKSTLIRAVLGILGQGGQITKGRICFQDRDLLRLSERDMRKLRGEQIGMIFQDAGASFCPVRTIGDQICGSLSAHRKIRRRESDAMALELFEKLGLTEGRRILESYPFELSGGMNQRVGIAAAMLLNPALLLADEPTSALDAVSGRQVIEEMRILKELYGTAVILVTHNIGVVSALADRVLVLHRGRIAECGETSRVLEDPQDAYTRELLEAVPKLRRYRSAYRTEPKM